MSLLLLLLLLCIVIVVVVVVVGGGTIGGSGCSSCGLRFEDVVVVVVVDVDVNIDVTTADVVFDATTSRHKGFEEILRVVNITLTVAADVIIPARGVHSSPCWLSSSCTAQQRSRWIDRPTDRSIDRLVFSS